MGIFTSQHGLTKCVNQCRSLRLHPSTDNTRCQQVNSRYLLYTRTHANNTSARDLQQLYIGNIHTKEYLHTDGIPVQWEPYQGNHINYMRVYIMTTYICVMIRNKTKESWGMAIGYPIGEHYTAMDAWREANEYIDSNRKVWPKMQFKIDMKEW